MTDLQRERLDQLLARVLPTNAFLAEKFVGVSSSTPFDQWPFTTKAELAADQLANPPYGRNLTYPLEAYSRLCQTSGTTTGQPLRWLDTPESWAGLLDCWEAILHRAGVTRADAILFPFSFGPFLGFWTAFEAAGRMGCLCLPAGGMSTGARIRFLLDHDATVVCCTPTYALHLAETANRDTIDLKQTAIHTLIVAGEPGGAIPATRARIEAAWGARVIDHYGMTEIGPVAVESCHSPGGLDVLEEMYIAEVIDPETQGPAESGQVGELVLTNLGRVGSPLIRYRTGDLVRTPAAGSSRLEGGILGRADDMIHLRGNNLYPSAIEAVLRRFDGVAEFRLIVEERGSLSDLLVEVEPVPETDGDRLAGQIAEALRDELLFRAEVRAVATGMLPRFEMKARRLIKR